MERTEDGLVVVTEDAIKEYNERFLSDLKGYTLKEYVDRQMEIIALRDSELASLNKNSLGNISRETGISESDLVLLHCNCFIIPYELLGGSTDPSFPVISRNAIDLYGKDLSSKLEDKKKRGLSKVEIRTYLEFYDCISKENSTLTDRCLVPIINRYGKSSKILCLQGFMHFFFNYESIKWQYKLDKK